MYNQKPVSIVQEFISQTKLDVDIFYEKFTYLRENQIEAEDSFLMSGLPFFKDEYDFYDVRIGGEKVKPRSINSAKNTNMTDALI